MPDTLFDWLLKRYPTAKRETLRQMVRDGRVRVDGVVPRTIKLELSADAKIEVSDRPKSPPKSNRPARLPFEIVHEDADILVVNKPPGLLTSTVPGERRPTLLAAVREYVVSREPRARVGLIHRLDRDAAGLLVFSKNDAAYQSLKTQFFHHDVERVYLAVTESVPNPKSGRIESWLEERADGTVYSKKGRETAGKGERAVTHYEVVETANKRALVRVKLETGRKHQIRVHLAERGAAIIGDPIYAKDARDARKAGRKPEKTESAAAGLRLLAAKLSIRHPRSAESMSWEIGMSDGFWPVS